MSDLPCFILIFFSLYTNYNVGSLPLRNLLNITYAWFNQLPFNKLGIESYCGLLIQ